jgi:hypothetical protein
VPEVFQHRPGIHEKKGIIIDDKHDKWFSGSKLYHVIIAPSWNRSAQLAADHGYGNLSRRGRLIGLTGPGASGPARDLRGS